MDTSRIESIDIQCHEKWKYGKFILLLNAIDALGTEIYRINPRQWCVEPFHMYRTALGNWFCEHRDPPPKWLLEKKRSKLIKNVSLDWYNRMKRVCKLLIMLRFLVDWDHLIGIENYLLVDIWRYVAVIYGKYVIDGMFEDNPIHASAYYLSNYSLPIYKTGADLMNALKHNEVSPDYYLNHKFCLCCWCKMRHARGRVICGLCIRVGKLAECHWCGRDFVQFENRKDKWCPISKSCADCKGLIPDGYTNITIEEFLAYRNNYSISRRLL